MLDTLHLGYFKQLDKELINPLAWKLFYKTTDTGYTYGFSHRDKAPNGASVHSTYYPCGFEGKPWLVIGFSLPRLLYGNNVHLVTDFQPAIEAANRAFSFLTWFPEIDLWKGKICRVDVCWNHNLGELVMEYLRALSTLTYSRRKTVYYANQGVSFQSNNVTTKFYDKSLESGNPNARGILRQETSYRKKTIKQVTGETRSFLSDLSNDKVRAALDGDLTKLKIKGSSFGTYNSSLSILCDKYGPKRGTLLHAMLLRMGEIPSRNLFIEKMGICRDTYNTWRREIGAAGLVPGTSQHMPLPPLSIPTVDEILQNGINPTKYQVILPHRDKDVTDQQTWSCKRLTKPYNNAYQFESIPPSHTDLATLRPKRGSGYITWNTRSTKIQSTIGVHYVT